ncbi:methylthioribose-1-phosphate isomerase [Thiohalospira halophila DSM 15071]|uniref:Methylthioribose-1-phosphate isomerase n=1 Tax=Thiohalospira halophila DSM 15071 TaxID=1123397 RepID=A0A1I1PCV7_9GAMM|nr:S-methyl-5-thioribose-1-phosphate isomerase [Thiohalospira halophila]SFD07791.1 methylthioribose-1-phosphate isomerase [Thiohalospira halophila DSM 15071]
MAATDDHDTVRAIRWSGEALELLDQRELPARETTLTCADSAAVADAIAAMVVRGAPAIGITAAWGAVLAAREASDRTGWEAHLAHLEAARPTAVNLAWATARMRRVAGEEQPDPERLAAEAEAIHAEDVAANRRMGAIGAEYIQPGSGVLTHCNTGSLATGGFGTALGVIRTAHAAGRLRSIHAGETRPWLQGARLTAWELVADGIPVELIADGAAAFLMASGAVNWVIVGADRVAANGDVANKIGTYSLAVAARHHGVGLMVVAPRSTLDAATPSGADIPVEGRDPEELLACGGHRIAAEGAGAWNPVFDITPASLVDVLVTEAGAVERPDNEGIARILAAPASEEKSP